MVNSSILIGALNTLIMFTETSVKTFSFLNHRDHNFDGNKIANDYANFSNKNNENHQKSFLLCESCFWCATSLINRSKEITISKNCPICNKARIKSLTISDDDVYKFN